MEQLVFFSNRKGRKDSATFLFLASLIFFICSFVLTQQNEKVKNNKSFNPLLQNKESLAKVMLKSKRKRFCYASICFVIHPNTRLACCSSPRSYDLSCRINHLYFCVCWYFWVFLFDKYKRALAKTLKKGKRPASGKSSRKQASSMG